MGLTSKTVSAGSLFTVALCASHGPAYALYSTSTAASATALHSGAVVAGTVGGAIGFSVSTIIEAAFIWREYSVGRISAKKACALVGISVVSNASAAGTLVAGIAIGGAAGAAGGPVGVAVGATIGAIVASVLVGLGVRVGLNKLFEKYFNSEHKLEIKLKEEAMEYFFGSDKDFNSKKLDTFIKDEKKFNGKILRKKYRKLAKQYHPDRNRDDEAQESISEEWLQLSSYYGILIGIWEKMQGISSEEITNADDLDEEELSLVANSYLKQKALLE